MWISDHAKTDECRKFLSFKVVYAPAYPKNDKF